MDRVDVLGVAISGTDMHGALQAVESALASRRGGYICFTNVHAVVTAGDDEDFRRVTNDSFLSLADGKAVFWFARALGYEGVGHVPGPDFMLEALQRFSHRRHFFYGSTPETLDALLGRLRATIPGLQVCGAFSPPFGSLGETVLRQHYVKILETRPDFVWVGLGAPKQEKWMAAAWQALGPALLFGVGAAFDFHAGTARRAPVFMRRAGLEWLFRLASEPRRLWKRYLVTNTRFLWHAIGSFIGRRM